MKSKQINILQSLYKHYKQGKEEEGRERRKTGGKNPLMKEEREEGREEDEEGWMGEERIH